MCGCVTGVRRWNARVPSGPYRQGQAVTFQVQVATASSTSVAGLPGICSSSPGQVSLSSADGTPQGSPVTPDRNGWATLTSEPLRSGENSFLVEYSGNCYIAPAQSMPISLTGVAVSGDGGPQDFVLSGASSIAVQAGSSVTLSLSLTPENRFDAPVEFSCSGLPATDSCSVPAALTQSSAVQVPVILCAAPQIGGTAIAALTILFFRPRRRGRVRQRIVLVVTLLFSCVAGCGGGYPIASGEAEVSSYLATVTATSGSIVHAYVVNVAITR